MRREKKFHRKIFLNHSETPRKRYRLFSNKDSDLATAMREESLRGTIRSVFVGFHKKKHRCAAVGRTICGTCRRGERMKEFRNLFGAIRHLKATGWKYKTFLGHASFQTPPYILSYEQYRARDAPSRRSRSRHLLLALFFPATGHLHNYNLASAVSKTRAARFASTVYIRF